MKIFPSILSADFANLSEDIKFLSDADGLHFDVMDGHFVPNLTFGKDLINACRVHSKQFFDIHLMINQPDLLINYLLCGDLITFHLEAAQHPDRLIQQLKDKGKKVGVALLPSTRVEALEWILEKIDLVLIMSVNPGFSGQKFLDYSLKKIAQIKKIIVQRSLSIDIQVDGGINLSNIARIRNVGADIAVVGNGIFKIVQEKKYYSQIIHELRNAK